MYILDNAQTLTLSRMSRI